MSVSAWCLRSDSAVATTSSRQLGKCWKSPLGRIHFQSMRPTSSGSYTTASGSRRCSSSASVVLPAPNPPLIQMITDTRYLLSFRGAVCLLDHIQLLTRERHCHAASRATVAHIKGAQVISHIPAQLLSLR